jgi:hypothetical protein
MMRLGIWLLVVLPACRFGVHGVDLPAGTAVGPDAQDGGPVPGEDLASADLSAMGGSVDLPSPPDLLAPPPAQVGAACNGSCGGGLTCMTWVGSGYCSTTCKTDGDCPTGSSCHGNGGDPKESKTSYCLVDYDASTCTGSGLSCRDCGANVCAPASFCDGC